MRKFRFHHLDAAVGDAQGHLRAANGDTEASVLGDGARGNDLSAAFYARQRVKVSAVIRIDAVIPFRRLHDRDGHAALFARGIREFAGCDERLADAPEKSVVVTGERQHFRPGFLLKLL